MSQKDNSRPAIIITILALAICISLPLGVSTMHGGMFFKALGGSSEANSATMMAMACCFIFSMPIIANLAGWCFDTGRTKRGIAGVLACFGLFLFSNISSTLTMYQVTGETIHEQVSSSPEITTFQDMITSNKASIASAQAQIDGRDPVRWAGKRDGWAADIARMQNENVFYLGEIATLRKNGNGSTTAQAFIKLAEFGITRFGLSSLSASLLDIVTFVVGLMLGGGVKRYRAAKHSAQTESVKQEVVGKKSAGRLHAV